MKDEISTLVISEPVYAAIRATIAETPEGLETGVTLFGARRDRARVALAAVGPGSKAVHTPGFHEPDAEYVNCEFDRLRESFPSLQWIGSLHVHPFGMQGLSGHDHRTVAKLLALHPVQLYLPDFIAGIIQRRRERFAIYPYFFEVNDPMPWLLPLQIVAEDAVIIREAVEHASRAQPAESGIAIHAPAPNGRQAWYQALRWFAKFIRRANSDSQEENQHDHSQ